MPQALLNVGKVKAHGDASRISILEGDGFKYLLMFAAQTRVLLHLLIGGVSQTGT